MKLRTSKPMANVSDCGSRQLSLRRFGSYTFESELDVCIFLLAYSENGFKTYP